MSVWFRWAVFECAGVRGCEEMGVVEESFGALGQEDGRRLGVGEGWWEGSWVWIGSSHW